MSDLHKINDIAGKLGSAYGKMHVLSCRWRLDVLSHQSRQHNGPQTDKSLGKEYYHEHRYGSNYWVS